MTGFVGFILDLGFGKLAQTLTYKE
jgi:hypothetical protein